MKSKKKRSAVSDSHRVWPSVFLLMAVKIARDGSMFEANSPMALNGHLSQVQRGHARARSCPTPDAYLVPAPQYFTIGIE